jgi:hypothetical protein
VFDDSLDTEAKKQAAEWLAEICKNQGKYDELPKYANFLIPFATQNEDSSTVKSELTKSYGTFIQQRQDRLNKQAIRQRMRLVTVPFIVLLLALFVFGYLYRKNKRKKTELEKQFEAERLAHVLKQKALSGRLNNPVMNSDPDGEFFGTVFGFVSDMIDNIFDKTFKNEQWDWSQTQYGWEIDKGLFQADPNKTTGGQAWELISRFTWQLPQTLIGNLLVSTANALEMVSSVTYGYGVTAVDMNSRWGAVTVSNYTAGPSGFKADWRDHLFVHEYGHYIQSQQHGPLYLFSVAIPSGLSALIHNKTHGSIDHRNRWFEADASYKGSAYFDKYYGSGKEGYVAGSPDFFDRYSFAFEDHSPYKNPRTGRHIQNPHPISGKFHWTDIPITGISIEVLLFLLSL